MGKKSIIGLLAKLQYSEAEAIMDYEKQVLHYTINKGDYVDSLTDGELAVLRAIIAEEKGHLLALSNIIEKYDTTGIALDMVRRLEYAENPLDKPSEDIIIVGNEENNNG